MSLLDEEIVIENTSNYHKVASLPKRFTAFLIDFILLSILFLLMEYLLIEYESVSIGVLLSIIIIAYKPLMESELGCTIGKLTTSIKVVQEDGNDINISSAIIRYFPWIICILIFVFTTYLIDFLYPVEGADLIDLIRILEWDQRIFYLKVFGCITFIVFTGNLLFNDSRQGVHDKAAKTIVVTMKSNQYVK